MILRYRCVHLSRAIRRPILVLCYNRALADQLRADMQAKGVAYRVHVKTFHAWCRALLLAHDLPLPRAQGDEFSRQLVTRTLDAVAAGKIPIGQHAAILVDEGNDFQPEWLRLIARMVDPAINSLLVLFDDAQSIYTERHRGFSFRSVGIQAIGRTTILRVNYRNTAEILRAAHDVARDVLQPEDAPEDGVPLVSPESARRTGPVPELVPLANLAAESDFIAREFHRLQADGIPFGSMAVTVRNWFIREQVERAFGEAKIPLVRLGRNGNGAAGATRGQAVNLVTWHSSKGLEFPVVAIPGLGRGPRDREGFDVEVRLLYVAMTRAMDRLILTYDRESALVARLREAGL
jgi:superfamily I DNA/RNA helicase